MAVRRRVRGEGRGGSAAKPKRKTANGSGSAATEPVRADRGPQTAPAPDQAGPAAATPKPVAVHIEVIQGGITNVKVPIAITSRYEGLPLVGTAAAFDRKIDSWLSRALQLGMVGSGLGQLFLTPLQAQREAGKVQADNLLLVGLGEPGHFAPDDLRLAMANVTVAVRALGHHEMSTHLLGSSRDELPIDQAVRGFLLGILDGYEHLRAVPEGEPDAGGSEGGLGEGPLRVALVENSKDRKDKVLKALREIKDSPGAIRGLALEVDEGEPVQPEPEPEETAGDVPPDLPLTLVRVTSAPAAEQATGQGPEATVTLQFSALGERAVIAVRDAEANAYFLRHLPGRLAASSRKEDQEAFGVFFANYLVPEDFRRLVEQSRQLALIVDKDTACYPWEMGAFKGNRGTKFFGTDLVLTRQFHTLLSPPPSSPPPLNDRLEVLLIADPSAAPPRLPRARDEARAVIEVLERARTAWRGHYTLRATVRIGSPGEPGLADWLGRLKAQYPEVVASAEPCDPLELAMRIVNEPFDVIHYAGHAVFDEKANRAGWVFGPDCVLTAQEIFRVRQVPRLVFANACFSSATTAHEDRRGQLVGVAQAFFARGIQNYIGTGWTVNDDLAETCARWFYSLVLGLKPSAEGDRVIDLAPPATIGCALALARERVMQEERRPGRGEDATTWGAYQHYGRANDKLLPLHNAKVTRRLQEELRASLQRAPAKPAAPPRPAAPNGPRATPPAPGADLVYLNGIDAETGTYAVPPIALDALVKRVRANPGGSPVAALHGHTTRLAPPYGVKLERPEEAGWGVVFAEDTPQDVREALAPLLEHRRKQAGGRFKALEYRKGEQVRDWYGRLHVAAANIEPDIVPYYLLLVGGPTHIPFEFQYLLGVEYAVGRLAFDRAEDYASYARSVVAYETAAAPPNAREVVYWGTRHDDDKATELSTELLLRPLADGVAGAESSLRRPIHEQVRFARTLYSAEGATRQNLLAALHRERPPALLFTASHGMVVRAGGPEQRAAQGALLCQDWPGFGRIKPEHYLTAADIADDAHVSGLVAFTFACFAAGTPDRDQFLTDLSQAGAATALAPEPFVAALPQRLLAHPRGGALAVIGHIDRAYDYSIQPANAAGAQIGPFRNGLGFILSGTPVGHAVTLQFGQRYAALSTDLLSAVSPTAPAYMRPADRELVTFWLQRNDAQNYVVLGDPAVRLRADDLV